MKVIIFGAGAMGRKYCIEQGSNTEILAFADNDPEKWGKTILGHPIIDPKSIPKESFDKIIIAVSDLNAMTSVAAQLKGMNVPRSKLVNPLLQHLNPIDLGYFTADYGPAIDSKKLRNSRLFGNRYDVLNILPKNMVCAEIGVAYGDFSQKILEVMKPQKLFLFDIYPETRGSRILGTGCITEG